MRTDPSYCGIIAVSNGKILLCQKKSLSLQRNVCYIIDIVGIYKCYGKYEQYIKFIVHFQRGKQ